ncbi:hypothetical protein N7517_010344 [Penicillium concentricum]|uniref:Uncharacterized protein n=1 Tax=Penicillium concentricum TaxID=293559 RepID=A0A9W9UUB4_9EURO|nr:uncharacterized protein N7517_010344 [Penicillium concentricum]KAJ5355735.1 hypothetical protein N7517_010344 [Penicillium concentricum]
MGIFHGKYTVLLLLGHPSFPREPFHNRNVGKGKRAASCSSDPTGIITNTLTFWKRATHVGWEMIMSLLLDLSRSGQVPVSSQGGCLHRIVCNKSQSQSQHVFLASQLQSQLASQGSLVSPDSSPFLLPPDVVHRQTLTLV